jgi:hypothetical protein
MHLVFSITATCNMLVYTGFSMAYGACATTPKLYLQWGTKLQIEGTRRVTISAAFICGSLVL